MAPEQARGDIDQLDERCDVFGLGAILCEVLTGQPPYTGTETLQVLDRARRGDLGDAHARLDRCGADPDLVRLARNCLAVAPADRPLDAGVVAEAVADYLALVTERLRQAGLAQAAAQARAAEERKRRRLTVALTAQVLGLVLLGGVGGLWWQRHRADQAAQVAAINQQLDLALQEAELHFRQGNFAEARAAARRADGLAAGGSSATAKQRARELLADLEMVRQLEEIRLGQSGLRDGHFDTSRAAAQYAQAFRQYGIDVGATDPTAGARQIQTRAIRTELLAALDDWVRLARNEKRERLVRLAQAADPEPKGLANQAREALLRNDLPALKKVAAAARDQKLSPASATALAKALQSAGEGTVAVDLLRAVQQRHPGDFWVNHDLGYWLMELKPPRPAEAIGYYRAALAVRSRSPGAYVNLGAALAEQGSLVEATAAYRQALVLSPDYAAAHNNLGNVLKRQGLLSEAVAAYQRAIALRPGYALAYYNLGLLSDEQGKLAEAVAAYRRAVDAKPDYAMAHLNLGNVLHRQRQFDKAIVSFERAVAADPKLAWAHSNLGNTLREQGQPEKAVAVLREAVRLQPDFAEAYGNLGLALADQGKYADAEAACRKAIALKPRMATAHAWLGSVLGRLGKLAEAETACRHALALQPDLADAHYLLGNVFTEQGKQTEAVAALQQAVTLQPDLAAAHDSLGVALVRQGKLTEGVAAFRKAVALKPKSASCLINLGVALQRQGQHAEALTALRQVLKLLPPGDARRAPVEESIRQCERRLRDGPPDQDKDL
jgi:serine/threonine-protein kinase